MKQASAGDSGPIHAYEYQVSGPASGRAVGDWGGRFAYWR